jgi:hypothetical protein
MKLGIQFRLTKEQEENICFFKEFFLFFLTKRFVLIRRSVRLVKTEEEKEKVFEKSEQDKTKAM